MREIVPQVLLWSRLSEPHGYDFNGFLVLADGGNLCIDPVDPDADAARELVDRGVARILLTNRNHVRAASRVRELTGAPIAIHPDDAAYARSQGADIADELHPGHRIGPLVVVGVPGKSPGEVAFHWPERRVLIVGDAVIGNPPGHCSLLRERVLDDPPRLQASVEALLALDFDVLLTGDGAPITAGAHDRMEELVARFPARP
ncbi:MAG TPA: MBL fold metallo-hydrolase [Candidatus Binatia bacterium]|nr:MBL fold metallo-hydrolase [Candidatus Binatia bacterium]